MTTTDHGEMPLVAEPPADVTAYVEAGAITADDLAAAGVLVAIVNREGPVTPTTLAWVAMALALRTPRDGHTCVDLATIGDWAADVAPGVEPPPWPADATAWRAALASAGPLVGRPGERTAFILDGDRLYLARGLAEEEAIATRLVRTVAGATAPVGGVRILLGGPGTGKTTEVARRLIAKFRADPRTRIALAAPTGKAAARMAEALRDRCVAEHAPAEVLEAIDAARPVTVHRLLRVRPHGSPRYRFSADNPLDYDLVVVDETSMLSSSLMHRLLEAVSPRTELLLVGDPDQLASVEAGSVLADVARAAAEPDSPLAAVTDRLTTRHRFGAEIGALADAILAGDAAGVLALLGRERTDAGGLFPATLSRVEPGTAAYEDLVVEVVAHARRLGELARKADAVAATAARKELQVLCAHRAGPLGVAGWNAAVERRLRAGGAPGWYPGRPVMVTRNTPALDLFNGDVGVVVTADAVGPDRQPRLEAAFPHGRDVRRVPVTRLDEVATVHAMTIHKSQGSEVRHAVVVLPERPGRLVSRELFYTGVTRAIDRVTVVGTREVIAAAVARPIRRASGLADRLRRLTGT